MNTVEYSWKYSGQLSDLDKCEKMGVYLFVFDSVKPRIIYVGTTNTTFSERWEAHRKLFKCGGRTVWRPDKDEDVYELMKHETRAGYINEGKVWVPSNKQQGGFYSHHLTECNDYEAKWLQYVEKEYLPSISVWRCELEDKVDAKVKNTALILESKIQASLRGKYKIKYYYKHSQFSWLGKQEITDDKIFKETSFDFNSFPNIDKEDIDLLRN